jgi:hypothetical protein
MDANNNPTGLATIRSCPPPGMGYCVNTDDYLAGIDMTALATAYTSHTPATTLNKGIYGGSMTSTGSGTGFGDLFGLGAWEGDVFGFARAKTGMTPSPPMLISIQTAAGASSGVGTMVTNAFSFTNGWSGAGVSTKVTITVPPPPPPPQ